MSVSIRTRFLLGFLLANTAIAVVAGLLIYNRPDPPPLIQGVLLPDALELRSFSLYDHHNQAFSNEDLKGRWHLVSYGFTTCPDICPTTLSELAGVAAQLQERGNDDLRFLFYTVDHRRDTSSQIASYLPFFHPDFIGLTHRDDSNNPHLPFEKSLGIVAQLVPVIEDGVEPDANNYKVYHGATLFLINPQGQLQAILEADENKQGNQAFDQEKILRDYLAIRRYLG